MLSLPSLLTDKQHFDIKKAILDYLKSNGMIKSYQTMLKESQLDDDSSDPTGILEKKWTSIIRLQKKVSDLESKISQLESEQQGRIQCSKTKELGKVDQKRHSLPNTNPSFELKGHQKGVNCIAFHPAENFVVTGSDDCTIKFWDLETGSFERTLKGHTMAVSALQFSSDFLGKLL